VNDTEIKNRHTSRYSGQESAYGVVGKTMSDLIDDTITARLNGRRITLISYDDATAA